MPAWTQATHEDTRGQKATMQEEASGENAAAGKGTSNLDYGKDYIKQEGPPSADSGLVKQALVNQDGPHSKYRKPTVESADSATSEDDASSPSHALTSVNYLAGYFADFGMDDSPIKAAIKPSNSRSLSSTPFKSKPPSHASQIPKAQSPTTAKLKPYSDYARHVTYPDLPTPPSASKPGTSSPDS